MLLRFRKSFFQRTSFTQNSNKIFNAISGQFNNEKLSSIDGLRIDFVKHPEFKGGWVHLRPSNTEPIFRIISEGMNEKQAALIYNYFAGLF